MNLKMSKGGWKYHVSFEETALFCVGKISDNLMLPTGRRGYINKCILYESLCSCFKKTTWRSPNWRPETLKVNAIQSEEGAKDAAEWPPSLNGGRISF